MRLFFEGAAELLKDLERGATAGDLALLHSASHALKSASANVGAVVLSAHCKELEELAKAGSAPDAFQLVEAIREDDPVEFNLSTHLPRVA